MICVSVVRRRVTLLWVLGLFVFPAVGSHTLSVSLGNSFLGSRPAIDVSRPDACSADAPSVGGANRHDLYLVSPRWSLAESPAPAWVPTLVVRDEGSPLDLPSGGASSPEPEELPESIVFYGSVYEGDAFFWCLDRSGSMDWGGAWQVLRAEVREAIDDLSGESQFGLIAYGSDLELWSTVPQEARPSARFSAQAWLEELEPEGGTCLLPAGLALLALAQASDRERPVGFIVSDGLPYCDGIDTSDACLQQLPAANVPPIVVHTVYVSADAPGTEFLRELATRLGGSFLLAVP